MPRSRLSAVTLGLIALMLIVFAWQLTFDGHKDSGANRYPGISERDLESDQLGTKPYLLTHFGGECGLGAESDGRVEAECANSGSAAAEALAVDGADFPGEDQAPWPLSIIYGMFMHGGIWALLLSALFLWIFGPGMEAAMGRVGFLAFYVAGGAVAAYGQSALDPGSAVPLISAAGAVGAVIGAYLVLYPRARVVALVLVPLAMTAVEIRAAWLAVAWFGLQLLPGVGGVATPGTLGTQVIYLAPLAGAAFGAVVAMLLARRIRDPDTAVLAY